MGFGIRQHGEGYEVCITNLYGQVRLQDFWSPRPVATHDECEEYIARLKAASEEISEDIMKQRNGE